MSDLGEVIRLVETVRSEMREDRRELREDLREIKVEVKRTNGRVTVLETRDEDDRAGKKRLKDWYPQLAGGVVLLALSQLLNAIFIAH